MNKGEKMTTSSFDMSGGKSFWGLEEKLSTLIEPVTPDPEFVDALRLKLTQTPTVILESGKKKVLLIAAAAGMVTGVLLVWLLHRQQDGD